MFITFTLDTTQLIDLYVQLQRVPNKKHYAYFFIEHLAMLYKAVNIFFLSTHPKWTEDRAQLLTILTICSNPRGFLSPRFPTTPTNARTSSHFQPPLLPTQLPGHRALPNTQPRNYQHFTCTRTLLLLTFFWIGDYFETKPPFLLLRYLHYTPKRCWEHYPPAWFHRVLPMFSSWNFSSLSSDNFIFPPDFTPYVLISLINSVLGASLYGLPPLPTKTSRQGVLRIPARCIICPYHHVDHMRVSCGQAKLRCVTTTK